MAIRYLAGAVLLLTALSGLAQGRDLSLLLLIEELKERGYAIIYSNSVVPTGAQVHVESIDISTLERVLREQGLLLKERDGIWVISPGSPPSKPEPAPEDLPVETPLLETVIVTGTRHSFPRVEFLLPRMRRYHANRQYVAPIQL